MYYNILCVVIMTIKKKKMEKILLARDQEFSGQDAFHKVFDDI